MDKITFPTPDNYDRNLYHISGTMLNFLRQRDGDLIIPEGVTEVYPGLCTNYTYHFDKLILPASVQKINLMTPYIKVDSFTVDSENPYFHVEGNCLISNKGQLIRAGKDPTVPTDGSVIELLPFSFSGVRDIKKLDIPPSVKKIYRNAICGCPDLEAVELMSEPEYVGRGNFLDCERTFVVIYKENEIMIRDNKFVQFKKFKR